MAAAFLKYMFKQSAFFQGMYQLWYGPDLVHIQRRRERRTLMVGSAATLLISLTWGMYFVSVRNWPLVACDLSMVLASLTAGVLIWRKQTHAAAVVAFTTLFFVIGLIAWFFDVSTPQSPRTTHLYLLPLSVAALMTFRESSVWLRHGVAIVFLASFAFLSMRYGAPLAPYALPEDVRAVGGWLQLGISLALFYGLLHVMQHDAVVRSELEEELQQALDRNEFELHYQPQLDSGGGVIAAEALIRWNHPQRGLVLPGKFIEVAEQTGLILPIGLWVLQQACRQLQIWSHEPGCRQLRLAVNISQLQFRQADFVPQVLRLIERYGIHAGLLELELTESMLVHDLPDIIEKMTALGNRGVTFSLDDFGTGYSSLNYLKRLPLNQLKIDQSFVRDVLTDANDASIARTVVALGHNLGLTVIAEGVESEEQYRFLAQAGCEFFQGFLFSHALPAPAFHAYVQDNAATRRADATPLAA